MGCGMLQVVQKMCILNARECASVSMCQSNIRGFVPSLLVETVLLGSVEWAEGMMISGLPLLIQLLLPVKEGVRYFQ